MRARSPNQGFLILLSLTLALLFDAGVATAQDVGSLEVLDELEQQTQLSTQLLTLEQETQIAEMPMPVPVGTARVSLLTMYSAQQGSWPFEPFVHNGLFRAIAGYQSHHPRALVIQGGSITLQQLFTRLADEKVLSRHKDGYLLRYPLMIAPDAALLVENTALYLYGYSGTALINRGLLSLKNAHLESFSGNLAQSTDRPYRPFLINWAGSSVQIQGSELVGLGYNENLSRGVTSARSSQQSATLAPVRVLISDSTFEDMSVGLELNHALARVSDSRFSQMQQYAMDLSDSRVLIRHNRIDGVRNLSGIRLSGNTDGRIEENQILRADKSAIEMTALRGSVIVRNNQLGAGVGYGLLLRELGADAPLLIADNFIGNTGLSAIDGANVHQLSITGNSITGTPEYAISLRNAAPADGPVTVTGNHLWGVGKAMIRVQGIHYVVLGENQYQGNPLLQNLLIGDLLPHQASLLEMTLNRGQTVGLKMEHVTLLPLPAEG